MQSLEDKWVVCLVEEGRLIDNGQVTRHKGTFPKNSVGRIAGEVAGGAVPIWFIGQNQTWMVKASEVREINVFKTGDKYKHKICNTCHCLLPVEGFAGNQRNKHGLVRRPSCKKCRTDIDKRATKSSQKKRAEKARPKKGSVFRCPICHRRSIVGVTAKIIADHDHHTGNLRDFICDSCNTGLGRFKNGQDYLQNAIHYIKERDTLDMDDLGTKKD